MKRKGFTLIELLAVIVILAIIALIATPMVLNTIEDARKGAAKASALAYVDAIEKYIVNSMIDTSKPQLQAGVEYQLSSTNYEVAALANPETVFINDLIQIKGDKPESGYVIVKTDGTVEKIEMIMNDYPVMCTGENCNVVEKEYESYNVADAVTIDGVGYHVIKSSSKYDKYVTLLRDESIGNMPFDENGGTNYETSTIKTYLNGTYKDTFGDKKSLVKEVTLLDFGAYEIIDGGISVDSVVEGTYLYLFINYRDTFLEPLFENSEQYIPKTFITKSVYTSISSNGNIGSAMILVGAEEKSIFGGGTYFDVMIMDSDGCAMSCSMGTTTCEANSVDILDAAAVRPVVVISKEALK